MEGEKGRKERMKAGIMNELSGVKCLAGGEWRKKKFLDRGASWISVVEIRDRQFPAIRIQTMTDAS